MSKTTAANLTAEQKGFVPPKGYDANKDWSYLQDKDPSETHVLYAQMMTRLSGVELSAKQVQVLLSMHRWCQQSDLNRERAMFRGRTLDSVLKGNETLFERTSQRAVVEGGDAQVVSDDAVKHIVGEVRDEILEALTARAEAGDAEAQAELDSLVDPNPAPIEPEPVAEAPKPARRPRKTAAQKKAEAEATANA